MSTPKYCSCCGADIGLETPRSSFHVSDMLLAKDHRPIQHGPRKIIEQSPQIMARLSISRNGGGSSSEHICAACVRVGLSHLRDKLNSMLEVAS